MVDAVEFKMDAAQVNKLFDKLNGPIKESLARRMGVSGGIVIRDEAKLRAKRGPHNYNPVSRGSHASGTLADSIYVAYNDRLSHTNMFVYSVRWNDKKTFWGKFAEFGHYLKYAYWVDTQGVYHTNKTRPLRTFHWVPATPFLGPALDTHERAARDAMIKRGQEELPKLLKGEESV